jgi:hypothetical protein
MFGWMSSLARTWRVFISYGLERDTLTRSVKTALVVGTVLGLINHGSALLTGHFTVEHLEPLLLTYLVPFSVATYGQIRGKQQRDQVQQSLRESNLEGERKRKEQVP